MKFSTYFFAALLATALATTAVGQTQRMVLVEERTSASCPTCGSQNPAFDARMLNNADKVALLKYQWGDGGHPDVMYDFNPTDVNDRVVSYYGALGFPQVWVNGTLVGLPNAYQQSNIDADAAVDAWFEITGIATISPERDALDISVSTTALKAFDAAADTGLVVHVAVVERTIDFGTPPGTNNESVFLSVMRNMLPSAAGSTLGQQANGESSSFTFHYPVDTSQLAIDSLQIVAFIQNRESKAVEQAAVLVPSQEPVGIASATPGRQSIEVWPTATSTSVRVNASNFHVLDVRGVRYDVARLLTSGNNENAVLDVSGLPAGHYVVVGSNGGVGRFAVLH